MHSLLHCAPTIIACCTTHSSIDSRCVGCTECLEVPWLAMLRLNWQGRNWAARCAAGGDATRLSCVHMVRVPGPARETQQLAEPASGAANRLDGFSCGRARVSTPRRALNRAITVKGCALGACAVSAESNMLFSGAPNVTKCHPRCRPHQAARCHCVFADRPLRARYNKG
jgi:hypothetical protein